MFSGTFISKDSNKPEHGTKVVIFVDSANNPTGVWEGVIHGTDDFSCDKHGDIYTRKCSAKITDPRVHEKWLNQFPSVNYDVLPVDEAVSRVFARMDEQRKEINGLQRKIKGEREVFHGLFKALVSPEAMAKLEELIGLLLKK
ncbi:MAG: hypothetical protein NTZ13_04555 [Candidatus Parcubacteria bacterium]|nr:hypothetical protein [Candidatus Parcubacteria bacterium]